jgi:hypothetical protein
MEESRKELWISIGTTYLKNSVRRLGLEIINLISSLSHISRPDTRPSSKPMNLSLNSVSPMASDHVHELMFQKQRRCTCSGCYRRAFH